MLGILLTHSIARRMKKPPFFFSRFNFEQMQERGNTHYCFHCISDVGFTPGPDNEPTNHMGNNGKARMEKHDESHASGVIGNADKYEDAFEWLEAETPKDFPYLISIPATC